MEMAERMGYIFHPTPYPPSLPFIPHVLFLIFLHLSVGIIFLLQLFRCPRCQEFSMPSYFHFRTDSSIFNRRHLPPTVSSSSSSTFSSSLSPFSPFLVSVQPSVNLSPDLGYSFSLKFPLGTDFEEIFSSSTVTFHREIDQRA